MLGERTLVMGILNITPDSFSDGGAASRRRPSGRGRACGWSQDGADILDVGGESTRPGADAVGAAEELRRVLPVIEGLAAQTEALLSIDTYKAERRAAKRSRAAPRSSTTSAGCSTTRRSASVAAETGAAAHPDAHARPVARDVRAGRSTTTSSPMCGRELQEAIDRAHGRPASARESIILDPGFGFAKRPAHSYSLLARLAGAGGAGPAAPLRALPQVVPEGGRSASGCPRSASGAPRRRSPASVLARRAHRPRPRRRRHGRRRPGGGPHRAAARGPVDG